MAQLLQLEESNLPICFRRKGKMKIQDYLKQKKIICDGAFGAYFADKFGAGMGAAGA